MECMALFEIMYNCHRKLLHDFNLITLQWLNSITAYRGLDNNNNNNNI